MLGRDRDFLDAECLCYTGYDFPGKDALEDTAHNGSGLCRQRTTRLSRQGNRHDIKVVNGIKVVIGGDKTHMVLVKGALQKPYFNHVTPDSALVFDDNRRHIPRPDFL